MEEVLQTLGIVALILLALIGLLAGWIASRIAGGRNTALYLIVGLVAAVLAPFIAAALGLTALVASGLIAILFVALIGAAIVLVIVALLFRDRTD